MNENTITLKISVEELLFLLFTLGYKTLPGLGDNPTAGLSEDQIQRAITSGFNALRAREWVQKSSDRDNAPIVVDNTLVAIIGICATASHLMFISRQDASGLQETSYIHYGPHLTVIHAVHKLGVHEFTASTDQQAILEYVIEMLRLVDVRAAPPAEEIQISQELLDIITVAVRDGRTADSISSLREHGLAINTANLLVESLSTMRANSLVTLLHVQQGQENNPPSVEGINLMESSTGFWLLTTKTDDGTNNAMVTIQPISAQDCTQRINTLLQKARTAVQ